MSPKSPDDYLMQLSTMTPDQLLEEIERLRSGPCCSVCKHIGTFVDEGRVSFGQCGITGETKAPGMGEGCPHFTNVELTEPS